jgi:hypothetical protein
LSGEEDEMMLMQEECKLYVLERKQDSPAKPENDDSTDKQQLRWAERGVGFLRLLKRKEPDTDAVGNEDHLRLVVRMRGTLRVLLNTELLPFNKEIAKVIG